MTLFPTLADQALPNHHHKLVVDLFAGGGGASCGIEMATGRMVDIAINHDPAAVALHSANHPETVHYCADVFEVSPREATGGRPVGFLWASPDCTHHSKARGGKPLRDASRKRRALAWVVTRWAGQAMPDVIALENVEEFAQWGPLRGTGNALRPCHKRKGKTFRRWVWSLRRLGYAVEYRELRACDYGAPTIRKRLFVIARRDGKPIVWPEPTHGPGLKPYRTAAECIDWTLPMCSIFATKEEARAWAEFHGVQPPIRPLAENTMKRIARGVKRFVLDSPKPFLVTLAHGEESKSGKRWGAGVRSLDEPMPTMTTSADQGLVSPFLVPRYGEREGQEPRVRSVEEPLATIVNTDNGGQLAAAFLATYHQERGGEEPRGCSLDDPIHTVDCANRHAVVAAFLGQENGGFYEGPGRSLDEPMATILANGRGHNPLVAAHIQRDFGTSTGQPIDAPLGTITTEGNGKAALVFSFLTKYYGQGVGQEASEPLDTLTTKDRFGLVTVQVNQESYVVADIGMRMLTPRELYRCQGFPDSYIIDRGVAGSTITKTEQVRMCGNSVCPPLAAAIVSANVPELSVRGVKS